MHKGKKSKSPSHSADSRNDNDFLKQFKEVTGRSRFSTSEKGEILSKKGSIMSTVKRKLSLRKSSAKTVPNEVIAASKEHSKVSSIAFVSSTHMKEKLTKMK